MTSVTWTEIEPYTTTPVPALGLTVYHDGDEEATVRVRMPQGELHLGETTGKWTVTKAEVAE
jgi:hypothetical protein